MWKKEKNDYFTYLEKHRHISYLGARKDIEAERPRQVLLALVTEMKGADAELKRGEFLHLKLNLLVPFFNSVVLIVFVVLLNVDP